MGLFGGGNSSSSSKTDARTTTGYQYGGSGGIQQTGSNALNKSMLLNAGDDLENVTVNQQIESLSDDVFYAGLNFAADSAERAATQMGNAIDANGDAVKRSLDFGDKALEEVSAMSGESLDTVRGVVEKALSASDDAYDGALAILNKNATNTADAFARASGGQAQETQETVRKLGIAFALLMGVTVIAYNWN